MPNAPGSRPLVAAVTAGVGALATLGSRLLLPDLRHLDVFGQHPPPASVALAFSFGSLVLGALLGSMTFFPGRRAAVIAGFLAAPLTWVLGMSVAVKQTLAGMTSGDSLFAALLLSPVFLLVASFTLVGLFFFCVVLSLLLTVLADFISARKHTVQIALLGVWAADGALLIAGLPAPDEAVPVVVDASPPAPVTPPCSDPPFVDPFRGEAVKLSWRRVVPEESAVEFTVEGPPSFTEGQTLSMVRGPLENVSPCLVGETRWTARAVAATRVPITFHLRLHAPRGTDQMNVQYMLDSRFRSGFESSLHLGPENFAVTSAQYAWPDMPTWVPHAFTCESSDPDVRCIGDTVEVRRVGSVPQFAGVKVDFLK